MTSEQVMLAVLVLALGGCYAPSARPVEPLASPYAERQVWAVAPLRNESGSLHADGVKLADQLAYQLENAANLDVLPVNRTLHAMALLGLTELTTKQDAMKLLQVLGADGLVVGTISAYDPYDPPRMGVALELYLHPRRMSDEAQVDVRRLTRASTDELSLAPPPVLSQPVVAVSAILDARSPGTRENLERYAVNRGVVPTREAAVHYRINMDLYSEFVSYVMCWRLLRAEAQRIAPPEVEPAS